MHGSTEQFTWIGTIGGGSGVKVTHDGSMNERVEAALRIAERTKLLARFRQRRSPPRRPPRTELRQLRIALPTPFAPPGSPSSPRAASPRCARRRRRATGRVPRGRTTVVIASERPMSVSISARARRILAVSVAASNGLVCIENTRLAREPSRLSYAPDERGADRRQCSRDRYRRGEYELASPKTSGIR